MSGWYEIDGDKMNNRGSNTTLVTESMEIAYLSVFLKVIINIHNPIFIST